MSKIGKKLILIPEGVKIEKTANKIKVNGPKGELVFNFHPDFDIKIQDNKIEIKPLKENKDAFALWGTQRALLNNAITGVVNGFNKTLIIEGLGYGAQVQGDNLQLKIGYSHPVNIKIPQGLQVKVEKNAIAISGIDKQKVGQFAASVRILKKPEPYKGKGIRYEKEVVKRKAGKKAITAAA